MSSGATSLSPSEDAAISWDIDITEAAEGTDNPSLGAQMGHSQSAVSTLQNGGKAQIWPQSVLRLSEDTGCRTAFLDDLYELNSFLLQQIHELTAGELGCCVNAKARLTGSFMMKIACGSRTATTVKKGLIMAPCPLANSERACKASTQSQSQSVVYCDISLWAFAYLRRHPMQKSCTFISAINDTSAHVYDSFSLSLSLCASADKVFGCKSAQS